MTAAVLDQPEFRQRVLARIPLGRLADGDDVAIALVAADLLRHRQQAAVLLVAPHARLPPDAVDLLVAHDVPAAAQRAAREYLSRH